MALESTPYMTQAAAAVALAGSGAKATSSLLDYEVNFPDVLYQAYNDNNIHRQVVSSVFLDNLLKSRLEVLLNDSVFVYVNDNLTKIEIKGSGYMSKNSFPTVIKTNASVAVGKKIALLTLFDSKSGQILTNKYGEDDITWIYAAKTQLNFIKDSIDNGGGIQRPILVGSKSFRTRTATYKTTDDVVTRGGTFAVGGTCVANHLRHAMWLNGYGNFDVPPDVSYYLLGLKTITGSDWAASDAQVELIRTTVQGKNPPDYNSTVWDYLKTKPGWTGGTGSWADNSTNRGYIDTWLSAKYDNPDNVFFSLSKAQTSGSTNAFSLSIALSRYKTLSDSDFTTRLVVGSTAGSLVTNANSYDVCTPTHIVMCGGENDRGRMKATAEQIRDDILTVKDIIKSEYPSIKVGIMNFPNQGTLFPENYKRVIGYGRNNTNNSVLFDLDKLLKANIGTLSTQISTGVYYIPTWQCMIPWSNYGDTVGYDELGEILINGNISNANNAIHPGLIASNSIGDVVYSWILSTL